MDVNTTRTDLALRGFVTTYLDDGTSVTARGPEIPADDLRPDKEPDTAVYVDSGGERVLHERYSSRYAAAGRYVELVEKYS